MIYPLPYSALTTGGSPAITLAAPLSWTLNGSLPQNYIPMISNELDGGCSNYTGGSNS